jgi:hypothetical protein
MAGFIFAIRASGRGQRIKDRHILFTADKIGTFILMD